MTFVRIIDERTPRRPGPESLRMTNVGPFGGRRLSEEQVCAVRAAMQVFVQDDREAGPGRTRPRWCDRCRLERPGAGFITYDGVDICNACATTYEIVRMEGRVRGVEDILPDGSRG
jgi:hypothetical protein